MKKGAPSGWIAAAEKWGTMPADKLFAGAIKLAEEGFPVGPVTSHHW